MSRPVALSLAEPMGQKRQLESWVGGALEYTTAIQSPYVFRLWAALTTVGAALQRRVWTRIRGQKQYANLYTVLVGPPGTGKGNAMKFMRELARKIQSIHIAPDSITKRALYDHLAELSADSTTIDPITNEPRTQAALTAYIDELGVFIPPRDIEFMVALSNLYDNLDFLHHKTAHHGEARIENICFNMIGGCTTSWIRDGFTSTVLEQGFPARLILVHSEEEVEVPLFNDDAAAHLNQTLRDALIHDLEAIAHLQGEMVWRRDAASYFQEWVKGGMLPRPSDPRLAHYARRRVTHVSKLAMILSAARRGSLEIQLEDVVGARSLLIDAEREMGGAIRDVGSNDMSAQMQSIINFINRRFEATQKGVYEYVIRQVFMRDIRPGTATALFDALVASRRVRVSGVGNTKLYIPGEPEGPSIEE